MAKNDRGLKQLAGKQNRNLDPSKKPARDNAPGSPYNDRDQDHQSNYAISTAKRGSSAQLRKSQREQSNRGRPLTGQNADSALVSAATLKQLNNKDASNETLDINGVFQPKSLRAKIDLKEGRQQSLQKILSSAAKLQADRSEQAVAQSKSKVMDQIG
jgi:hypothetical protein